MAPRSQHITPGVGAVALPLRAGLECGLLDRGTRGDNQASWCCLFVAGSGRRATTTVESCPCLVGDRLHRFGRTQDYVVKERRETLGSDHA